MRRSARMRGVARALALVLLACAALGSFASAACAASAPKRIVALTPFTANTIATLGIRPVGIGATLGGGDRFVAALKGVPRLPLSHPNGPNMEQLALLNPQLVFSSPTWRKGEATMRALHISVTESEPTLVSQVPAETRRIGKIVGRVAAAARIAAGQELAISVARKAARSHPTVLLVLGVGRTPFAFLQNSWGGDVVRQAGGRLLTGGLSASGGFARISDETIVKANPDVIIAVPHGNPGDIPALTKYLKSNPAWKDTRAAKTNHVYVSTDNTLLQPWMSVGRAIHDVQTQFLHNR